MLKIFHIRKNRLKQSTEHNYTFDTGGRRFYLPVNQVIEVNEYSVGLSKWLEFSVTEWIWNKTELPKKFQDLREEGHFIGQGDTSFGVDWDYIIKRRKDKLHCFYCLKKINDDTRTKDHVIPRAVLKAFGHKPIPNNTVPCCHGCNQLKASMHPEMLLNAVKVRLHKTGKVYYRVILQTLEQLLKI